MAFIFEAVTEINAPPSIVFDVVADAERWSEWCSWLRLDKGPFEAGAKPTLTLTPPGAKGYSFAPEILTFDRPREITWLGRTGPSGIFDGRHQFFFAPFGDGTRLTNRETYSGLLSPLMKRLPMMRNAQAGFDAMNEEIRARAEKVAIS